MTASPSQFSTEIAIAWCLFWEQATPEDRQTVRLAIEKDEIGETSEGALQAFQSLIGQVSSLQEQAISTYPQPREALKKIADSSGLQGRKIGLIYGGATKIKQYVFEEAQLQDIRGASALLDRINLIDTPALFHGEGSDRFEQCRDAGEYCRQVRCEVGETLCEALIPELIVYSTGGNILAFCPASQVEAIANAIEKRYTHETLTAQSCVVGDRFSPLEVFFGLLRSPIENTLWLEEVKDNRNNPALRVYFDLVPDKKDKVSDKAVEQQFRSRKNFNELVGKLANQFNQRRSGWDNDEQPRPSRRYPPMFETHPYLMRDDGDRRLAVAQISAGQLPDEPRLSEPLARKRWMGQLTKREDSSRWLWYRNHFIEFWNPLNTISGEVSPAQAGINSWVSRFEDFLRDETLVRQYDPEAAIFDDQYGIKAIHTREARSLHEIGAVSNGFVAYIYADGNNMGQYIRDEIATPEQYQQFSEDVFEATEKAVYHALAQHIRPFEYEPDARSSRNNPHPVWIHPFEIITIGGDDVLLVVPANQGLEIAETIGRKFEEILLSRRETYRLTTEELAEGQNTPQDGSRRSVQRYSASCCYAGAASACRLSISSGVLITAVDTPIYYADKLVSQLLKSAKKKAKGLEGYYGGTVDFLTLKAVTMISSNVSSFREEGLTKRFKGRSSERFPGELCELNLKLYAAPYTLYELHGLIETVRSLHRANFPKSQLYQIRSLLEQGRQTAILNYRYFRVRLESGNQQSVNEAFEQAWCQASTNNGNLAPWLAPTYKRRQNPDEQHKVIYSTIWREIVDLLPFIEELSTAEKDENRRRSLSEQEVLQ